MGLGDYLVGLSLVVVLIQTVLVDSGSLGIGIILTNSRRYYPGNVLD